MTIQHKDSLFKVSSASKILGLDPSMVNLLDQISLMSVAKLPVFVHGESGSGKTVVARALHKEGNRSDKPLVAVNCARTSPRLIEQQLFGYVKGAFKGADVDTAGRLEATDGGILLLDEVTALPLDLQAKLLQVFKDRVYTPLGSCRIMPFDAQIISTSSTLLKAAVKAGEFNAELAEMLEALKLEIPSLRKRGHDAVFLFRHYLSAVRPDQEFDLSPEFEGFLMRHEWPGNVRQLINLATRIAFMANEQILDLLSLPGEIRQSYVESARPERAVPHLVAVNLASGGVWVEHAARQHVEALHR